jgi:hypothetical protein
MAMPEFLLNKIRYLTMLHFGYSYNLYLTGFVLYLKLTVWLKTVQVSGYD